MKKPIVAKLTEAELVKLLGNDEVGALEESYDVDLGEGAISVTIDSNVATVADIDEALKLAAAKESLPMLIMAASFEQAAQDKAFEFEDVLLCTKVGNKVTPLIPA
jgi:hypothetical protein